MPRIDGQYVRPHWVGLDTGVYRPDSERSVGQLSGLRGVLLMAGDARRPSEVQDEPWVWAHRMHGDYPLPTARSGKWLVYVDVNYVDNAWEPVRAATEAGQLGYSAKVATAYRNPHAASARAKVICVYTYDWMDEPDVMRVREELRRSCAVKRAISYKADSDTLADNYGPGLAKYRA